MQGTIQTVVAALLVCAAALVAIVVAHTRYERQRGLHVGPGQPRSQRRALDGRRRGKHRELSFNSRAARRQEAAEGPADLHGRHVAMGGITGGVLATLLVKLWSMQVISGESYTRLAEANATTTYSVAAPRGRILDRNGQVIVDNRACVTVIARPEVAADRNVMRRLSVVLGMPYAAVRQRVSSTAGGAQADRVVMDDVPDRAVAFISEHPEAFPNVYVESRTERSYPYGSLAAHVVGYTGTITEDELASANDGDSGIGYESGDEVGRAGAEYMFESVLQGVKGERTVVVDAGGNVISQVSQVDPQIGNDVRLTIDINVQQVAEENLARAVESSSSNGHHADAGAVVCLDVKTGGVIAMASYPTFDPTQFVGGISSDLWESLSNDASGHPLNNRAVAGQYPAASTFKAFTGLAGLQYGYTSNDTWVDCTGTWTGFGEQWPQRCWKHTGHGNMNLDGGIVESCDVVFYEVARQFYRNRDSVGEDALQNYLMEWGFGSATGVDLPGEAAGRVPTPEWKLEYNGGDTTTGQWMPGDYSNLIIGQGDLLVTPLQIAQGYMCIADGGTSPKPHVLLDVLSHDGKSLIAHRDEQGLAPDAQASDIQTMQQALADQVSRGHVTALFDELPVATAGKTGTGEVAGKGDYAWYVGYGPVDDPQYCCACIVEQGGSGGTVSAPVVRAVLASALGLSIDFSTQEVTDDSR